MTDYQAVYETWKKNLAGTEYEEELKAYESDAAARQEAFYRWLEFGTAGMRGVIGLGTNMINVFTVRRASQGLANYLLHTGQAQAGVAIAYDSRRNSALFAKETALTLAANGVHAYLYDKLTSVPQLSFTVLQLHCAAGVVITASHNPAKYNGYKVYGADGGQIANAGADAIIEQINAIEDPFSIATITEEAALASGYLHYIGEELDRAYYEQVKTLCRDAIWLRDKARQVHIVYTPLHGSGLKSVCSVLTELGVENLFVVEQQRAPDCNFPTVSAPNPENQEAFDLAIPLANQHKADLILATDPDCDRLGVAVRKHDSQFTLLTGNQIGCLLLEYLLSTRQTPPDAFVVKSIVSSPLADAIAAAHGVEMRNVLTGFKYIAEQIRLSQESGQGHFIFGFEESYGFLAGTFLRDKDACIAAMLVTEAACYYNQYNKTLFDALQDIYAQYGYFEERVISITREGRAGIAQIKHTVTALRQQFPSTIAGEKIIAVRDYQSGFRRDLSSGREDALGLPAADVLYFELPQGSLVFRPSGTEPKLKVYVSVHANSREQAQTKFHNLENAVQQWLADFMA